MASKQEKIQERLDYVAEQLKKHGHSQQYIDHQIECIKNRDFSANMSDITCNIVISEVIRARFFMLPSIVCGL